MLSVSLSDNKDACTTEVTKVVGVKRKRSPKIEDDEEGDDCEDCHTEEEDDEETEEDRAFINDGKVEKLEVDLAAIDSKNIIQSDETGGRPKRQRKAPTRWEHPDAATVMQKFCDKWNVTDDDIKEIFEDDDVDEEIDTEEDSSFHSSADEDSDDDNVKDDDEDDEPEAEEETETDYETEEEDDE